MKNKKRGGARAGSGRKPMDLKSVRFNLESSLFETIDNLRGEMPRNTWVKLAIREKIERTKRAK